MAFCAVTVCVLTSQIILDSSIVVKLFSLRYLTTASVGCIYSKYSMDAAKLSSIT